MLSSLAEAHKNAVPWRSPHPVYLRLRIEGPAALVWLDGAQLLNFIDQSVIVFI
jgi:hypothetical protein